MLRRRASPTRRHSPALLNIGAHLGSSECRAPRYPTPAAAMRTIAARAARRRADRGSLSLELAILFPVVLMLTLGAVQTGLWFSARNMCQAAAEAGVRAGKVLNAPAGAGAAAARGYLRDVAGGLVVGPDLSEARTVTDITVSCAGQAQNVIPMPGLSIDLAQSSSAARERFTQ